MQNLTEEELKGFEALREGFKEMDKDDPLGAGMAEIVSDVVVNCFKLLSHMRDDIKKDRTTTAYTLMASAHVLLLSSPLIETDKLEMYHNAGDLASMIHGMLKDRRDAYLAEQAEAVMKRFTNKG